MISSKQQILIVAIIGIIIIFFLYNRSEGFVTNTEAINNIASLYNASNLTATNVNATANISTPNLNATTLNVSGVGDKGWNKIAGQTVFEGGRTDFWHPVVFNSELWTNGNPIFANHIWGANNQKLTLHGTVCFGGKCYKENGEVTGW
jgi:hypothetical protein